MSELENPFPEAEQRGTTRTGAFALGSALLALVLIAGLFVAFLSARQEVADLRAQVDELQTAVAGVASDVASTGDRLASLEASGASQLTDGSTASVIGGGLPRYSDSGSDPALGMQLGTISGVHFYDGQTLAFDPGDGKSRAWLVWAHWCPYCQQELPIASAWHTAQAGDYANFELVSITTNMDDTAPNPLVPYLEENQFPFPVLMDESGVLSRQLGVNAFPFWVFTGPDGTVVGRTAGLLPEEQLVSIFDQLEELGAGA